jgi:hypothetical protein
MIIKQGDSFLLPLHITVDGHSQDLTLWSIRSCVGNSSGVIAELVIEYTDRAGGKILLKGDSTLWPQGTYYFDIRYTTDSDQVTTTASEEIQVIKPVTPPGVAP